jgi:hypothetical protein
VSGAVVRGESAHYAQGSSCLTLRLPSCRVWRYVLNSVRTLWIRKTYGSIHWYMLRRTPYVYTYDISPNLSLSPRDVPDWRLRLILLENISRIPYYKCSETDPCIMRRVVLGAVYLLSIYVDDVLIIAKEEEISRLKKRFTKEFQWISMELGNQLSYLHMQIVRSKNEIVVDMKFYVEKVLTDYPDIMDSVVPGGKQIFTVRDSKLLAEAKRKKFHTTVARLLYLMR